MKLPPKLDTHFEAFLQALPADYHQMAYEFKAFERARKVKSPLQLLQGVKKAARLRPLGQSPVIRGVWPGPGGRQRQTALHRD